jgi:hypothetical protein
MQAQNPVRSQREGAACAFLSTFSILARRP